jgi:hypothetical protein
MYNLLALYARPFRSQEHVVGVDEKNKQLLRDTRAPLPVQPGAPAKHDYEYARAGTCNLFVAVEPKGGRRTVEVTEHRAKIDFVAFVKYLLEHVYAKARRIPGARCASSPSSPTPPPCATSSPTTAS